MLSFCRMNYPYFDPNLNVFRVFDLSDKILRAYTGDPFYGFCSVGVEKMFDNISMSELYIKSSFE